MIRRTLRLVRRMAVVLAVAGLIFLAVRVVQT